MTLPVGPAQFGVVYTTEITPEAEEAIALRWMAKHGYATTPQSKPVEGVLIQDAIDAYLRSVRQGGCRPKTIETYEVELLYFARSLDVATVKEVKPKMVIRWLALPAQTRRRCDDANPAPLTPRAIGKKVTLLREFFSYCQGENWLESNPMRRIESPKVGDDPPRHPTEDEYSAILRGVPPGKHHDRDVLILRLQGECAVRGGAVTKLKVRDIRFNQVKGSAILTLRNGKGGVTYQTLVFPGLARTLEKYLIANDLLGRPERFLFTGQGVGPLSTKQVSTIFAVARDRAGVHGMLKLTPHSLRHRYGHYHTVRGKQIVDISKMMGHRRISTTAVYAKTTYEESARRVLQHHPLRGKTL